MKLYAHSHLDELARKAAASPRLRAHLTIHTSNEDPVQRFFVAAQRDSYFRPHRHLTKSELSLVLKGRVDVLTFDDQGRIQARYPVGEGTGNLAYETPNGTWHTLLALTDGSAFFEVKEGPYDPTTAVEFAPWAPAEGEAGVARYQQWLRDAGAGSIFSG